ncbi:MAG: GDYXXLXY domain-containing protein [Hyphomicrobiaceae bacterium]
MKFALPERKWLIAGFVVAGLQTAALGSMVWDRIQLIRNGREIVLPIVPVDPRSLFRGDYVILSYEAQQVPASLITPELDAKRPREFYVRLGKTGDNWAPVGLAEQAMPATADQLSVKARTRFGYWQPRVVRPAGTTNNPQREPTLQVRYGIESYFVAEGKGLALEQMAREKKLAAVIAVDARGNAAIKGLMIDGKLQYEEPLL